MSKGKQLRQAEAITDEYGLESSISLPYGVSRHEEEDMVVLTGTGE